MDSKNKQYGLFKFTSANNSQKSNSSKVLPGKPSIFGDDSDSGDDDMESSSLGTYHQSTNLKRQTKNTIQKAIDVDPTIFQYDEIYDEIKASNEKKDEQIHKQADAKPKYISNLLKAAELRKREQEIRFERKIQKEREKEGDEFKDKESFVTASYREKLEEMRKTHEEMEKQDRIDSMLDVTKQKDLSGFYRGLYSGSILSDSKTNTNENDQSTDSNDKKIVFNKSTVRNKITLRDTTTTADEVQDDEQEDNISKMPEKIVQQTKSDKKDDDKQKETKELNIDHEKQKDSQSSDDHKSDEKKSDDKKTEESLPEPAPSPKEPSPPKLTRAEMIEKIFTKRTVGKVFEEARARYLERKRLRELN